MGFITTVILCWLLAMAGWWFISGMLKSQDFSKMKDRLTGKEKKGGAGKFVAPCTV